MNAPFKQDARLGRLTTALGDDVLVLLRFEGTDHLNGLFTYRIDALSAAANLDFDALIGTHASIEIDSQAHGVRVFDGIVTEAKWNGVGENGYKYTLTLRPWLWIAGQRRNQRIFHNKTVVQILEELLSSYADLGDPALQTDLVGSYPVLEYTVQYRESDLNFATRLMERFGISFHFAHQPGSHALVLTDAIDSHPTVPGATRDFKPAVGAEQTGSEHFWEWHPARRMTTGAVRLTDYNFKTPHAAMEVSHTGDATHENGQTEAFDYPGDYLAQGAGNSVVGLRVNQARGQDARHRAIGDCTSLGAGMLLTLTGDQVNGIDGADYLCLSANHTYSSDAYGTGGAADTDGFAYVGDYVLMPTTAPLAPEQKTRVPVVQGPQTAVVVGEGEIDCDEYGRILVHFHWDLNKAYSMRCRVSQNWASKGWGGMVIPRIGMEVVVEFLEGDPDKPIVTGCVYNGNNTVPYDLPRHKTRSTFKTNTHQGEGFNELRFEDEKGREEVYVHAQKDRNEKTRNNHTERIDRNWVQSVGHDKSIVVEDDHDEIIGGNMTLSVGSAAVASTLQSKLSRFTQGIGGLATKLRSGKLPQLGRGNLVISTEKNRMDTTGMTATEMVGVAKNILVGGRIQLEAGSQIDLHSARMTEVDSNGTTSISAAERVTVNCGESRLTMEADGTIHLHGNTVNISANDAMQLNAGKTMVLNAGDSMVLKAKRVDIN